jgi:hypothetical protein
MDMALLGHRKVVTLPPQLVYGLPSRKVKSWVVKYGVCLANYDEEERKFTTSRITPAIPGRQYEVVHDDNGDPMISSQAVESVRSDLIVLKNNTSNPVQTVNLGFVTIKSDIPSKVFFVPHCLPPSHCSWAS